MTAPSNGRPTPTPPPPERTAARTGRVGASLEALAGHLEAAAASVRALAEDLQDELADRGDPRLMDPMPPAPPATGPGKLLTAEQVGQLLSVKPKTVRRWEAEGLIPGARRIANVVRWDAEVVERWLAEEAGS